jgi:hypothetical protein
MAHRTILLRGDLKALKRRGRNLCDSGSEVDGRPDPHLNRLHSRAYGIKLMRRRQALRRNLCWRHSDTMAVQRPPNSRTSSFQGQDCGTGLPSFSTDMLRKRHVLVESSVEICDGRLVMACPCPMICHILLSFYISITTQYTGLRIYHQRHLGRGPHRLRLVCTFPSPWSWSRCRTHESPMMLFDCLWC